MSLSLVLQRGLNSSVPDTQAVTGPKQSLHSTEAHMVTAESKPQLGLQTSSDYKATFNDSKEWDPSRLAQRNICNDPEHAYSMVWANRDPVMDQQRRKIGLIVDESAALRSMETQGHIQSYLCPEGAPPMTTERPTPGWVKLPGLRP